MPSQYEIPAFGTPGDKLLGFCLECVQEGDIWLGSQKPTQEWAGILPVLGAAYGGAASPAGQSSTGYNRVRREFREVVATLANFRHAGEFATTEKDSKEFFDRAHLLTNLDEHWWRVTFAHEQIRAALMQAVGKGTSYLYQDWDKSKWGPGRGDIRLRACDPSMVTFIQLPNTHEIQQAYVVLIRNTLPLQLAKRMYASNPTFANALRPDGNAFGSDLIQRGLNYVQKWISPALRTSGTRAGEKNDLSYPTVDIWDAYTIDGSVNPHAEPLKMGVDGTNWSYTVPALGDPVPQGIINPATGQQWTLPATPDDCLMFPLRRLTIFSRTGVAYDGSSPWWHGATPVTRLRFNDLPWEALGASQVGDAKSMQDGVIALIRNVEDSAAARLDPPAEYNDAVVDKAWAEAFNPRKAGVRAGSDFSQGEVIRYPFPPGHYDVPQWIVGEGGFIRQQEDRMDYVTCARDLVAVAKARQIPSADTMEKMLEMAGPIVQDMVQGLIRPLTELGEWRKALYFQFYTRQRMIRIADPNATELMQDVKYIPDNLVPYVTGEAADARTARVRSYLSDFRYEVSQSGVSELNRMSTKLLYLQLSKSGFPISPWTLAAICQIPNFGPPPEGTNTEMERYVAWVRMRAELQMDIQSELAGAEGVAATGGETGRPPGWTGPPKMVTKDGGSRTTVTTS